MDTSLVRVATTASATMGGDDSGGRRCGCLDADAAHQAVAALDGLYGYDAWYSTTKAISNERSDVS